MSRLFRRLTRDRASFGRAIPVWALLVSVLALAPLRGTAQSTGDVAGAGARRDVAERQVRAALARGDTAAALEAQRRVVSTLTPGSAAWRRASALAIALAVPTGGSAYLRAAVDSFRASISADQQPPELDGLVAMVARRLLVRDDTAGAAAVLKGVDGPRATRERGYLLLRAGDIEGGRTALLLSVSGLQPAEATGVIQIAGLLGRLSPAGSALLARAGLMAHTGRGADAARLLEMGLDSLARADSLRSRSAHDDSVGVGSDSTGARADTNAGPVDSAGAHDDGPPLLAEAARLAEAQGADSLAARLRARLLRQAPDAPEASEAALELARYRARTPAGRKEALRLLTDLVTRDPAATVVPEARRELQRLQGGGGG